MKIYNCDICKKRVSEKNIFTMFSRSKYGYAYYSHICYNCVKNSDKMDRYRMKVNKKLDLLH